MLIERPTPPPVPRPLAPHEQGPTCTCDDVELDELARLVGDGMGQWEASRLPWGPSSSPVDPDATDVIPGRNGSIQEECA